MGIRTRTNLDRLDWSRISCNPSAIGLLKDNPDKIDWIYLSSNPAAMHLFETNLLRFR